VNILQLIHLKEINRFLALSNILLVPIKGISKILGIHPYLIGLIAIASTLSSWQKIKVSHLVIFGLYITLITFCSTSLQLKTFISYCILPGYIFYSSTNKFNEMSKIEIYGITLILLTLLTSLTLNLFGFEKILFETYDLLEKPGHLRAKLIVSLNPFHFFTNEVYSGIVIEMMCLPVFYLLTDKRKSNKRNLTYTGILTLLAIIAKSRTVLIGLAAVITHWFLKEKYQKTFYFLIFFPFMIYLLPPEYLSGRDLVFDLFIKNFHFLGNGAGSSTRDIEIITNGFSTVFDNIHLQFLYEFGVVPYILVIWKIISIKNEKDRFKVLIITNLIGALSFDLHFYPIWFYIGKVLQSSKEKLLDN